MNQRTPLRACAVAAVHVALLVVLAPPALGQDDTVELREAFRRKPGSQQQRILDAIGDEIARIDDPYLSSLLALAAAAREPAKARAAKPRLHSGDGKKRPIDHGDLELLTGLPWPCALQYRFGVAVIDKVDYTPPQQKGRANPRLAELDAALAGDPPQLGAAMAQLLRSLDTDHNADAFGAFLDSWRNGSESFYRALDRTAGTEEAVFFYDVLLNSYLREFVPRKAPDAATLRKSKAAAHDSLHRSFLTYRQYRAFREALALSWLLPAKAPLPAAVARYAQTVEGGYSTRQQALILLAACGFDLARAARSIVESAEPLPEYLWTGNYDAFGPFNRTVSEKRVESGVGSDELLEAAELHRVEVAEKVAAAARSALAAALAK